MIDVPLKDHQVRVDLDGRSYRVSIRDGVVTRVEVFFLRGGSVMSRFLMGTGSVRPRVAKMALSREARL